MTEEQLALVEGWFVNLKVVSPCGLGCLCHNDGDWEAAWGVARERTEDALTGLEGR